jgi:hypothetical protein
MPNFCLHSHWEEKVLSGTGMGRPNHWRLGYVFSNHSHLILRTHPSSLRLEILRPPSSRSLHTLPHATWQWPPFASLQQLQYKPSRNLSTSFDPQACISTTIAMCHGLLSRVGMLTDIEIKGNTRVLDKPHVFLVYYDSLGWDPLCPSFYMSRG